MKYDWKPEVDVALREIYSTSASRHQFTLRIRRLMEETGISRAMLHYRATRIGLRLVSKRKWTIEEDMYLEENAGQMPVRRMAKILGRSQESISCRILRLNLEARFRRGYSLRELAERLGACETTVQQWQRRGWLRLQSGRYSPETVGKFLREHIEEISIKRVDEEWLKRRLLECFAVGSLREAA